MSRSAIVLEPQLEGEIAIHRRHAGAASLQRLETAARPPAVASAPAAPVPAPPAVEDFERIEDYLRSYLEHERFRSGHPLACGRWIVAWEMLWCADSRAKVIAVGRRAREVMQAFGSSLLESGAPLALDPQWPALVAEPSPRPDPIEAVAAVLGAYGEQLGEERGELLVGLLEHWRLLAEAVARHEQAQAVPAERLRWEDGRRLVLFTALLMVEIDRSFA